uniref:Uncharacterized protein n=1 Tax=Oryza rufipogon TaxID=4529 RepID=A0A0E0RFQ6_ORYRU
MALFMRKKKEEEEEGEKETRKTARLNGCGSGSASCVIAKRPTPASLREAARPRAYGQDSTGDTLCRLPPGAGPVWRVLPPSRPLPLDHATAQRLAPADSTVLPLAPHSSAGHAGLKAKLHRPRVASRGTPALAFAHYGRRCLRRAPRLSPLEGVNRTPHLKSLRRRRLFSVVFAEREGIRCKMLA